MKQGTSSHLPIEFIGIKSLSNVDQIEFVFKRAASRNAPVIRKVMYMSDGSGEAQLRPGTTIFDIPWSAEDMDLFKPYTPIYLDTRISYTDTYDAPETPIVSFSIDGTLFQEG